MATCSTRCSSTPSATPGTLKPRTRRCGRTGALGLERCLAIAARPSRYLDPRIDLLREALQSPRAFTRDEGTSTRLHVRALAAVEALMHRNEQRIDGEPLRREEVPAEHVESIPHVPQLLRPFA